MPGFALVYGAVLLDEAITAATLVGLRADPRRRRARLRRRGSSACAPPDQPGLSVSIRRARADDVDFLVELYADEDVGPFLAAVGRVRPRRDRRGDRPVGRRPGGGGVFVVELDGERAGAMVWERANVRSRIAHVSGLAVHPDFRGAAGRRRRRPPPPAPPDPTSSASTGSSWRSTASTSARSGTPSARASSARACAGRRTAATTAGSTACSTD